MICYLLSATCFHLLLSKLRVSFSPYKLSFSIRKPQQSIHKLQDYTHKFDHTPMALRATNLVKAMVGRTRGSTAFATSTSPKMKSYSPAVDHGYGHQDPKPRTVKGQYVPVYISLGLIMMSVSFGVFTATHQLKRSPNVFVKKSKRESFPELVEPEKVAAESDDFIKKSFFRKIAHVQDADRQYVIPEPIRGDAYAMHPKPHTESLKSVGVEVEKKPFVQPPPLKH